MGINLSDSEGPLARRAIPPQLSSSIYTIIGFAWSVFGCIFITLLCSTDWFALKIIPFFPLVVLLALLLGHLIALFLESDRVTSFCYFFKRGMPLIFYRRFAFVEEPAAAGADATKTDGDFSGKAAITFGQRRVLLSAVDELYLTLLGTLEIRSYAASGRLEPRGGGAAVNRPDILVKVPLSVLGLSAEKQLVELFRSHRPDLVVNKRLDDRLSSPVVKGQALIQSFGALVIVLALVDVSYATFTGKFFAHECSPWNIKTTVGTLPGGMLNPILLEPRHPGAGRTELRPTGSTQSQNRGRRFDGKPACG